MRSLGRDLHRGVAPAALAVDVHGCDAKPVAGAAGQAAHRLRRTRADARVGPGRRRHGIGTLLDDIALGVGHRVPAQIDLAIAITRRRGQALRLCRRRRAHDRARAHIHTGAENQLLVTAGDAFNIGGQLRQQLIQRVFLLILNARFFFGSLPRSLHVAVGGFEFVCCRRDVRQGRRRGWKVSVTRQGSHVLPRLGKLFRNAEASKIQTYFGHGV